MAAYSDRLGLPLLAVAQAQKEMTHNEALALLDIAVQPVVQSVGLASGPATPVIGQCWIVGTSPAGAWTGYPGALAGWTAGGWRFLAPFEGMQVWSVADGCVARHTGGTWTIGQITGSALRIGGNQVVAGRQAHIASPSAGGTIDTEARTVINAMLAALRTHGLIASS